MRKPLEALLLLSALALTPGFACAENSRGDASGGKEAVAPASGSTVKLPPPDLDAGFPLVRALAQRHSVRSFTAEALTLQEISQLCWAAQGVNRPERGFRTAPSAGALYPLELYLATPDGLFRYVPSGHELVVLSQRDVRPELAEAALRQSCVEDGVCVFVLTAVYARTSRKYGERAERYVHIEAGHAAQNLLLQAEALGLGAVPIGAFYDDRVQAALGAPDDQAPLLIIPAGHPE